VNVFLNIFTARIFYIHTTMNRDIITADIDWKEDTTPFIDLKVEIDDDDFSRNIYIEDIKLYNQNSFVNPTNASGGISIFSDVLYGDKKVDKKKRITVTSVDDFFTADKNEQGEPVAVENHFFKNDNVWTKYTTQTGVTQTYNLGTFYYSNESAKYNLLEFEDIATFDITKHDIFIETDKTKVYDFKDLQNDSSFTQNFNISNDIIIISVKIHPNPNDKCQSDYILKAVYNKRLLLLESMAGVREINDTCTIPRRFIDFILRQKAIDLAQANNDVDLLCKYFRMFSGSIGTNKIEFAPCGCLRG